MQSQINVSLRIKPLGKREPQHNIWKQVNDSTLMNTRTKDLYAFDHLFSSETTTSQIFDTQVKSIVHSALKGVNQTVFAYGQTSSGKTFTMRGPSAKTTGDGLIPLSVKEIFAVIKADPERKYKISVSYLEVSPFFLTAIFSEALQRVH